MTTLPIPVSPAPRPASRPKWFGGNMPAARWGLIVNLLVPFVLLAWDAWHGQLGADATKYAIHTTGLIAVLYLLLSLVVTPLRQVTGFGWLVQFRRSLGVYAFYYAAAHLAIYFWWDRQRSVSSTAYEITHRVYLMIGFASLALMAPLWATSFNAAIRWMGGKKWKWLHRLAYAAAFLACVHYYLQSKSDKTKPTVYMLSLLGLLAWRVGAAGVNYARRPAKSASAARAWRGDLKVVAMRKETPNVRTFRLATAGGGPLPFRHAAGQYLNLAVQIDGKRVNRSYTIATPPTRDYLELSVKREENGHVSHFLHDMLMTGDAVAVSGPAGRFTFDPTGETAVLLVAGGVGVTPVMAILRDLTDRRWTGKVGLVFSVHTPADVIFADELKSLSERFENVTVHVTCTRDVPADWPGERGRIDAAMLTRLVPDLQSRRAFVCGPDAMARAVVDQLKTAGVPENRITTESFTPAAAPPASTAGQGVGRAVTLTFSQSNVTADLRPGQTILDAAEAAGVPIDYVCRAGVCGTCKCRLVEGRVTMPVRDALTDAEEADGYVLACQAYAETDVTVEA